MAEGRIAPFEHGESVKKSDLRYAPSFVPGKEIEGVPKTPTAYTVLDIGNYLGRRRSNGERINGGVDVNTRAALDALYLLEVRAIKTFDIKSMNWSRLGKFVADMKARPSLGSCVAYFNLFG